MVYCKCEDWKKGMSCIVAAQALAFHHGWAYEGETMCFCPWCGKRLKKEESEKRAVVRAGVVVKPMAKKAMRKG